MNVMDLCSCFLLLAVVLYRCSISDLFSGTLNSAYLTPAASKSLRGLFSLVVVLDHMYQMAGSGLLFPVFIRTGYMAVGFFFFISGYGLIKRTLTDKTYHKGFLLKRIPSVLIPYILANFIYWIYNLLTGTRYSVSDFFTRIAMGDPIVSNSWYIISILLCYVFFWISICATRKHPGLTIAATMLCCAGYVAGCIQLNFSPHWIKCIAAFPLGLIWAVWEERLLKLIDKAYFSITILAFVLFGSSLLLQMLYGNMSRPPLVQALFCNTTILLFVLCLILVTQKLKICNPILDYFGERSLEIYLYHGMFLLLARPLLEYPNGVLLYFLTTIAASVTMAHITYIVNKWLLKRWSKLLCTH